MAPPEQKAPPLAGGRAGHRSQAEPAEPILSSPRSSCCRSQRCPRLLGASGVQTGRRRLLCLALDDLADDCSTLLAEWAGRMRPRTETPPHIVQAAIAWRAERARGTLMADLDDVFAGRADLNDGEIVKRKAARETRDPNPNGKAAEHTIGLDDFVAYMPQHSYIFRPTARCGRRPASMPASRRSRRRQGSRSRPASGSTATGRSSR